MARGGGHLFETTLNSLDEVYAVGVDAIELLADSNACRKPFSE